MQTAMNNENKSEQWTGKGAIDRTVSEVKKEVKKMDPEDIKNKATEITSRVRDFSTTFYSESRDYMRRNPVSSALGLAAIGFFMGMLTTRAKKSA